ncbi:hypothetical protein EST38_g592 [Candolleomyces aberdarensis]|uniref:1-alkyl-2-acetylglycerophosphocholine esterase n=1 Tax=Candolleomyces aberdarensis TaxID=2316362 RepID=A0A4Q2E075_9AGAR|nr:hypothetical protein EST38_g592 [Candolleomyces aberdarensis]
MLFLPAIKGRYAVGVTTFVTPVHPPRPIGSVKLRNGSGNPSKGESKPALLLEEVAYTAYYPADISAKSKKGVDWFIRPIRESLDGFAAFLGWPTWVLWPIVYLFGSFVKTKIPAYPNVPLLHPRSAERKQGEAPVDKWPLVIFSHGLGGSRTAYRLAASGRVVLAVEHRDGTGTVSMPRSWHVDGNKSEPRTIVYLRESDIHWDDSDSIQSQPFPLRAEQLAFRHHEVYITYNSFHKLLHKDPEVKIETIDGKPFDKQSWGLDGSTGEPLVNCDTNVVLGGHSFGGCTVLSILSTNPPAEYLPLPVERAIVLDPWLEPLPAPGPVPVGKAKNGKQNMVENGSEGPSPQTSVNEVVDSVKSTLEENSIVERSSGDDAVSPHPRMLVINSETFTVWKDHFARLQEVVKGWEPEEKSIITLVASKHTSFSDFPILPVFSTRTAHRIFNTIANLSVSFLDRRLEEELKLTKTIKKDIKIIGVKKDGKPKRKLIGTPGDVIVE